MALPWQPLLTLHALPYYHTSNNFLNSRCRDGKRSEQKQELGWRISVLPIPAFHHCELLHVYTVYSGMQDIGMGNTDTLHPC